MPPEVAVEVEVLELASDPCVEPRAPPSPAAPASPRFCPALLPEAADDAEEVPPPPAPDAGGEPAAPPSPPVPLESLPLRLTFVEQLKQRRNKRSTARTDLELDRRSRAFRCIGPQAAG
jgi:hypothetical protein